MKNADRLFARLVASLAVVAVAGLAHGFVEKQATAELDQREFQKRDLYISSNNVKMSDVEGQVANRAAWDRFFADYGDHFVVFFDPRSGTPSNIMGHIPLIPGRGVDNAVTIQDLELALGREVAAVDYEVVAGAIRRFVQRNKDVIGIHLDQLGPTRADKITDELWQVSIAQLVDGIPVRYGRLAATINNGNLVLIGTETWGNVSINTVPTIASDHAVNIGFNYAGGKLPIDHLLVKPSLEIVPFAPPEMQEGEAFAGPMGQGYGHRLVWKFEFQREGESPSWRVSVDAHTGEVIEFTDTNHYATRKIVGGIYPLTNTEICPNNAQCGVMQTGHPMPFANTGFAAPNNFTNSAGLYDYLGGTLTTTLSGKHVRVVDTCGTISESSTTGDLDLGGVNGQHDCTSAGSSPGDTPASRSAFYEVNKLNELARGWLPNNTWLQSVLTSNVNLTQTCNAFYSTTARTINFYRTGGGCRNTGEIAAVFDHEWGHAMDHHDTGAALSNSSEAYADMVAIYRLQASCVGHGFFWTINNNCGMTVDGTGFNADEDQTAGLHCNLDCSGVRDTDWNMHADRLPDTPANFSCSKCNSGTGPCGRQVHCDAAPSRQAGWDLPNRDLAGPPFNYDSNTAYIIANKTFYQGSGNIGTWHACTCPSTSNGCGATNAYMQWLAADDDNGNINDGTPRMTALFQAFDRHGIACATPTAVNSGCADGPTDAPVVTVAPGSNQVTLNWTSVPGATRYWVLRGEGYAGCDFSKALIATVTGNSYTDPDVANNRTFFYTVMAVGASSSCFGRASTCIQATPQPCAGAVTMQRTKYNCADNIVINLVDSDLIGAGTHVVTIRSTTETTPENVTLTENPANSGQFGGTIETTTAAPTNGDGLLSVVDSDTITVRYVDVSYCGVPNVDVEQQAAVDCVGPTITNVRSQNVTGNKADILWNTNEAANSTVIYDTVVPPVAGMVTKTALALNHAVTLSGLTQCTPYFFAVRSMDDAGNSTTNDNAGTYYTFATGVNVNPTYSSTAAPVPIPDNNPTGAVMPISVADNKTVLDVDVTVNITHTYDGDLILSLIAPNNTSVVLSNRRGGSGDNFTNTVFDDDATTAIAAGTAPFTGRFRPDVPLANMNGLNALGTWQLKVVDAAGIDTGNIVNWSLHLTFASQACGPSLVYQSSTSADSCTNGGGGGGNGVIEPGEDVIMDIRARNNGTSATTGVSGTLSSSTPGITIMDPAAAFPDIPADGSANSLTSFAFSLAETVPCGTMAEFTINFSSNEGNWSDSFSMLVGTPGSATNTRSSTDVPRPIPDVSTITSNLVVTDPGPVTDVDVQLSITHTYTGDLVITLIGPEGTRVPLANRRGGSGDNFVNTVFDDAATTPISSGSAPFTGRFRPESPLSVLNGVMAAGTWKLEVRDAAVADTGTLQSWSLILSTNPGPLCTNCVSATAGAVGSLRWTPGLKTSLDWSAAPNASFYKVYRGTAASLPDLLNTNVDSCLQLETTALTTGSTLIEGPPVGSILWYLVTGNNAQGEGTAGDARIGTMPTPRVLNSSGNCPVP